jgi:natural product biosynthesis luciferase-like monooxygenase protein
MDQLAKRLAALSPAQRELLARRLEHGGAAAPSEASRAAGAVAPPGVVAGRSYARDARTSHGGRGAMQFSLFFFSADGLTTTRDKYQLLTESAKYADEHGFSAVWTPERHFQAFGGLYPNPSVLGAALAMITQRVQIRAGSVALPLHDPIRVAEDWSVVDNLSGGRVGISFASGWHAEDFVLAPSNYEERKEIMFRGIETVRRLWAGEAVKAAGGDGREVEIRIMPRPVQGSLPVWVTSSGSRETWVRAGAIGANMLSGLRGDPRGELAQKIALYRDSRARHGHDPLSGRVTVMLHTFVGPDTDAVKEQVRGPLTSYLRTFIKQGEQLDHSRLGLDAGRVTEEDKDALAAIAFESFFNTSSLLGAPDKCAQLVGRLEEVGVDEIACLIDFGLDADAILAGLRHLNELRARRDRAAVG